MYSRDRSNQELDGVSMPGKPTLMPGKQHQDSCGDDENGFDHHSMVLNGFDNNNVLRKSVDRFMRGCKSLMLEYERGCKETAARAIMEWSLHELASIGTQGMPICLESQSLFPANTAPHPLPATRAHTNLHTNTEIRLMHDPGTSEKRKILAAGNEALAEALTTACLGFGKIAKQKGDRALGRILAGSVECISNCIL